MNPVPPSAPSAPSAQAPMFHVMPIAGSLFPTAPVPMGFDALNMNLSSMCIPPPLTSSSFAAVP